MSIDDMLLRNEDFIQQNLLPSVGHLPRKSIAVVTCMDCRLVQMFEQALGLERGDVLELRTAGATIPEQERSGLASDLIRSLAAGIYLLGVQEVAVIGHTQCGLANIDPTTLIDSMRAWKVDHERLIQQEGLGNVHGLIRWLGSFQNVHINVGQVVEVIRNSPYLPKIPVHGLVIDINTGKLELVDRAEITSIKYNRQSCDEVCTDMDRADQFSTAHASFYSGVNNTFLEEMNSTSTVGD